MKKYRVTFRREVEHTAVVEVNANTPAEAEAIALNIVDAARSNEWREGDVLGVSTKVQELKP